VAAVTDEEPPRLDWESLAKQWVDSLSATDRLTYGYLMERDEAHDLLARAERAFEAELRTYEGLLKRERDDRTLDALFAKAAMVSLGTVAVGAAAWALVERDGIGAGGGWPWAALPLLIFFAYGIVTLLGMAVFTPLLFLLRWWDRRRRPRPRRVAAYDHEWW
jgi:hypothetical protein